MKEVFKIVAKKRIIGMLVMSGLFLLMIGTVFAAYTFQRLLTDNKADIGTVAVTNKKFVNYSAGNSDNAKLRVDTVVVIEGLLILGQGISQLLGKEAGTSFQEDDAGLN